MLSVKIVRDPASFNYKKDPEAPGDWHNNDNNNSLDTFEVYDDETLVFSSPAQTIANMEGLDKTSAFSHTVSNGVFTLVTFVDPRSFYGDIHGIANTVNIAGDPIGRSFITGKSALRYLVHDWQKKAPIAPGNDTRVAWSDGCFVLPTAKLAELSKILKSFGYRKYDKIDGIVL